MEEAKEEIIKDIDPENGLRNEVNQALKRNDSLSESSTWNGVTDDQYQEIRERITSSSTNEGLTFKRNGKTYVNVGQDNYKQVTSKNDVYVDEDNEWHVEFKTPCEYLDENNLCSVYSKRPKICRDYGQDECHFHNEYSEKYSLETLEDVENYIDEVFQQGKHEFPEEDDEEEEENDEEGKGTDSYELPDDFADKLVNIVTDSVQTVIEGDN